MELTYRNVQRFCGRIDTVPNRPVIDLSSVTWVEPYAVVYLGMFLRYHNSQGKYFSVTEPTKRVCDYLHGQNFWSRFNFNLDPDRDMSLLRTYESTSFGDIVDIVKDARLAEDIDQKLNDLLGRRPVRLAIEECVIAVTELVDNFTQHADVILGAMMVQYYPKKRELRVALGDCGTGIKGSLLASGKYPEVETMPHTQCIAKAFTPLVTCKPEGGMGLCDVLDTVVKYNGTLFLSSHDGGFYVDTEGKKYVMLVPYGLPGVHAELTFFERS